MIALNSLYKREEISKKGILFLRVELFSLPPKESSLAIIQFSLIVTLTGLVFIFELC